MTRFVAFDAPAWLCLLPFALLPWLRIASDSLSNAWIAFAPPDRASQWLDGALRALASLTLVALAIAMAGPYRPEYPVQRTGHGAEIVLVLDRSRSMDQGFGGRPVPKGGAPRGTGPETIDYYMKLGASRRESKGQVARQVLSEFAAKRPEDRFALIVFSTLPIRVLGFTQKPDVIQAAIAAGTVGRGLSETNIGLALEAALMHFEGRPYSGSRLIMLVSDGGDRLDPDMRVRIAELALRERVAIDWIYLRSTNSPGLTMAADEAPAQADNVPEYFLHRYFQSLPTAYRAYEAGDPEALQKAVDDVSRLQNLPIDYIDIVPRRDLARHAYIGALLCVLLLAAARGWEIRRWT